MNFFKEMKQKASKTPKIVILPELGLDKNGVIKETIEQVKDEGTAVPIGLTPELIEASGKLDEFMEFFPARRNMSIGAIKKIVKKPVVFAAMMVKQGYAHSMVAGRYGTSAKILMYANAIIGEEKKKIRSAIFFRESPKEYPIFDLIACADMVSIPNPNEEELYRIIVTSAETFVSLTGKEPTIALLSYITGSPRYTQADDPNIKKIIKTLELCDRGNHPWSIYQSQVDAALTPTIANDKGIIKFIDHPADLLIGSNLLVSNIVSKLLEHLVIGGNSMIITQGYNYPVMDLSRGDSAANIANVTAACSVLTQISEKQGKYRLIDEYFLNI